VENRSCCKRLFSRRLGRALRAARKLGGQLNRRMQSLSS
jgi:hypothetical protein